jgi:FixJ family two-component response regulator
MEEGCIVTDFSVPSLTELIIHDLLQEVEKRMPMMAS